MPPPEVELASGSTLWTKFDPDGLSEEEIAALRKNARTRTDVEVLTEKLMRVRIKECVSNSDFVEAERWVHVLDATHQAWMRADIETEQDIARVTQEDKIKAEDAHGVGRPSAYGAMIPLYGNGRSGLNDFQNGRIGWGLVNSALAIQTYSSSSQLQPWLRRRPGSRWAKQQRQYIRTALRDGRVMCSKQA